MAQPSESRRALSFELAKVSTAQHTVKEQTANHGSLHESYDRLACAQASMRRSRMRVPCRLVPALSVPAERALHSRSCSRCARIVLSASRRAKVCVNFGCFLLPTCSMKASKPSASASSAQSNRRLEQKPVVFMRSSCAGHLDVKHGVATSEGGLRPFGGWLAHKS